MPEVLMPPAKPVKERPDYGNWVSSKWLYVPGGAGILFLGLSFLEPVSIIGAIVSLVVFAYFSYARYEFSPHGGGLEDKIRGLVLDNLDWDGKGMVLDIGCGNGPLTIAAAKRFQGSKAVGTDSWGTKWEYSKATCEKNASIEHVRERVTFQKVDAASMPFEEGLFDAAVSNLVFHEVKNGKGKREVVKEALRVVKKGGAFSFQDLFLSSARYGDIDSMLKEIRSWGVQEVEFIDTGNSGFIPGPLKVGFMVGGMAIIRGRK